MLLINLTEDATGRWFARFVASDSVLENMNLLERYVKKHGRRWVATRTRRPCFRPW
jgi:hypothetical protein